MGRVSRPEGLEEFLASGCGSLGGPQGFIDFHSELVMVTFPKSRSPNRGSPHWVLHVPKGPRKAGGAGRGRRGVSGCRRHQGCGMWAV